LGADGEIEIERGPVRGLGEHRRAEIEAGSDPGNRWLAIACIGSFAAIGLHSFVDFNLYIPANALLLAWISGVALATGKEAEGVADWRRVGGFAGLNG
jgi:hypothetical protein